MKKISDGANAIIQFLKAEYGDFPDSHVFTAALLPIFDDNEAEAKAAIDELAKAGLAVRSAAGDQIASTSEAVDFSPDT